MRRQAARIAVWYAFVCVAAILMLLMFWGGWRVFGYSQVWLGAVGCMGASCVLGACLAGWFRRTGEIGVCLAGVACAFVCYLLGVGCAGLPGLLDDVGDSVMIEVLHLLFVAIFAGAYPSIIVGILCGVGIRGALRASGRSHSE